MSEWSEWLDFDRTSVESVPESPGVCMMHASMKVMYIGGSANIRQILLECLLDSCTSKAKRFHYLLTPLYDQMKEQMLKDYAEKHGGSLPVCMGPRKAL
jgi:hypothetical protein